MAALVGLGLVSLGCSQPAPAGRYNLILISIDTLRADRLGSYGYLRDTTPRLDSFAARGVVFENVVAESNWTLPSHVTLLTGLYPATHGVVHPALKPGDDVRMLAEILRSAGYETVGLTEGGYLAKRYDIDRGFDVFNAVRKGLDRLLDQTERYMAAFGPEQRFFLFLHTSAVRCAFDPPEPYASRFSSPLAEPFDPSGICGSSRGAALTPQQALFLSDRYDGSILRADDLLGGFLALLEASGRLDDTVVVITSDHGDQFLEHGGIGNEGSLHRELLMVPLIVLAPGVEPARVAEPAGLVDVVPTVLSLLGIETPPDVEGRDLLAPTGSNDGPRISELSWRRTLESAMTPTHHLIRDPQSGDTWLYSLSDDPGEKRDVSAEEAAVVTRLGAALDAYHGARERRTPGSVAASLTYEQRQRLRAYEDFREPGEER